MNFTLFPTLVTQRLILRQLEERDDAAIFSLRSDDRVNRFVVRPKQTHIGEARAFISKINTGIARNEWIYWAITLKDEPTLIGTICIWNISADKKTGELGYELTPAQQGKGIMKEAIGKIIEFAFHELAINTLEAFTHKENTGSTKLLLEYNFILQTGREDPDNKNNTVFTLSNTG